MCQKLRKKFTCPCKPNGYKKWDFCIPPTPAMRPRHPERPLGFPCDPTYLEYPEKMIQYQNCCRLQCCAQELLVLQEKVRRMERNAAVQSGARQGLDFEPRIVGHQQAMKELRHAQTRSLQALKKHLHGCASVIKPNDDDSKGIVTFDRVVYDMPPAKDDEPVEFRRKILTLFTFENRLRKKRNRASFKASAGDSKNTPEEAHQSAEDLEFQRQGEELMAILEGLDREFSGVDATKPPQEVERQSGSPAPSIFAMSDLD